MEVRSEIGAIIEPVMEYFCDCLCRFPKEVERQEDLNPIMEQQVDPVNMKMRF